jgi:hypothetical protein
MIDFDILVKLGWTALLGWNLRETVANGKKIVKLETLVENGISHTVDTLAKTIDDHIEGEEHRIIQALHRDPKLRTRKGDRRKEVED